MTTWPFAALAWVSLFMLAVIATAWVAGGIAWLIERATDRDHAHDVADLSANDRMRRILGGDDQ